jgi:hypothetical protein
MYSRLPSSVSEGAYLPKCTVADQNGLELRSFEDWGGGENVTRVLRRTAIAPTELLELRSCPFVRANVLRETIRPPPPPVVHHPA